MHIFKLSSWGIAGANNQAAQSILKQVQNSSTCRPVCALALLPLLAFYILNIHLSLWGCNSNFPRVSAVVLNLSPSWQILVKASLSCFSLMWYCWLQEYKDNMELADAIKLAIKVIFALLVARNPFLLCKIIPSYPIRANI